MDAIPSKDNCWIQLAEKDTDVTQQCVSLEHMMNVMDSAIDSVEFLEGKIAVSHEVSQIDDAFIRLSIESMKYTCKMLYVDVPAQVLSLEIKH